MMVQNQHSSPDNMDSPKAQDHDTVVLANNKTPPLEGEHYMKIGGMWTLKHEIRLPKLYELLTKTELKGYTALNLNNLVNHVNMCLNVVTRLQ